VKKCPYCTADIAMEAKKCKFCGEWVEPGGPSASEPAELKLIVQPPTRGPTKTCPYCSAQIPEDAWTCMYCKCWVLGGRPLAIRLAVVGVLIAAIFFFGFCIFFFGFWLPGWMEFDREWNKTRQEQEEFRKRLFPGQ
jgi:hypothetical protein